MAGFDNDVVYAANVDFTGGSPVSGQVTTNGQLLIGSTASPNIRVGSLASAGGTIVVTTGAGTIDLATSGSAVGNTLTGNTGGARSPTAGNWNIVTSNSTVTFIGAGSTLTQDFNATSNVVFGSSLPATIGASTNTGVGFDVLKSLTSGSANVAVGGSALDAATVGGSNTAIGASALSANVGGGSNIAVGSGSMALFNVTPGPTATNNTAVGTNSLNNLTTGTSNITIGQLAGTSYTTSESSNILLGNSGTIGESNVMRLGTQGTGGGQVSQTFLAGVLNHLSGVVVKVTTPGVYPYTALITDYLILVDTSSARTINLMATPVQGTVLVIKDNVGSAAANNITITPAAGNIDGAASTTINIAFGSVTLIYNGTQWNIV